jgi:hypothetical protein
LLFRRHSSRSLAALLGLARDQRRLKLFAETNLR